MVVADLTARLGLDITRYTRRMREAVRDTRKIGKELSRQLGTADNGLGRAKSSLKDIRRIVQGIFVSKMLYGTLNSVKNLTASVWEFSNSLEYAQMTYKNLFGDTKLAKEFINVLEDYSAVSPFSFTDAEAAAKRLLAYGIEYKNVMYVMQGVLSAASAQGNSAAIESISRALGQIYTKGKLSAEELRQLAEAGVPVYKILQEELGITAKQLGSIGKQAIPAETAINALVTGINKRFSGVLADSAQTRSGMLSNIKDNLQLIAAEVFKPATDAVGNWLKPLNDKLQQYRTIVSTKGVGGLFESIVPERAQQSVRILIANCKIFFQLWAQRGQMVRQILSSLIPSLLNIGNIVLGMTNTVLAFTNTILGVIGRTRVGLSALTMVLTICAAAWTLWKARMVAALVVKAFTSILTGVTKSVMALGRALTWLAGHPILLMLSAVTVALLGLATVSGKTQKAVDWLNNAFTKLGNVNTDKLLLPSQKERAADLGKFNKALDGTSKKMNDVAKSTKKASDNLQKFDEVYQIKEPDGLDGVEDELDDIDSMGLDFPEIELPDVTDTVKKFVDSFKGAINKQLVQAGIGAMIGGVLGAAIGGLLGNPLIGAKIGAIAGAIAGWFWQDLKEAFSTNELITAGIGGAIGAVLGGLVTGSALGGIVGAAAGTLAGLFWGRLSDAMGSKGKSYMTGCATIIGGIIGTMIGGPGLGTLVGAAGGMLVGNLFNAIVDGCNEQEKRTLLGNGIGAAIGAILGTVIGGPGLGTAIGALAGSIAGMFCSDVVNKWESNLRKKNVAYQLGQEIAKTFGEVNKQIDDNILKRSETTKSIQEEYNELQYLVNEAYKLADKKILSDAETQGLLALIAQINEKLPGVNLQWDATNQTLSEQKDTVDQLIQKTREYYMTQAAQKNLIAVYEDLFTNARELEKAQQALDTISQQLTHDQDAFTEASEKFARVESMIPSKQREVIAAYDEKKQILSDTEEAYKVASEAVAGYEENNTQLEEELSFTTRKIAEYNKSLGTSAAQTDQDIAKVRTSVEANMNATTGAVVDGLMKIVDTTKNELPKATKAMASWKDSLVDIMSSAVLTAKGKANEIKSAFEDLQIQSPSVPSIQTTLNGTGTLLGSTNYRGAGHANGGIFDREHYAKFAEGNKREAIIPLENQSGMAPFVEAVSNGLTQSLAPMISNMKSSKGVSDQQIMYVGTLIADERSLKELNRRINVIRTQEQARIGG